MIHQIVARRDRGEHLAHCLACGLRVARAHRRCADDPAIDFLGHLSDNVRIPSTAARTTGAGTSLTISTFPIFLGRTKCTTPCRVFLSDCRRFKTPVVWNFIRGGLPKPRIAVVMRSAVTLSSLPEDSAISVAAIIPHATASPCKSCV